MKITLPIFEVLPELRQAFAASRCAVLSAPPGSGKTTGVPPALLSEPWMDGRSILLLEPRRLAARLAAEFMARQRGEKTGQTVGYRVRFDAKVSAMTRIEVLTEGILTRRLQNDPELSGVGLVIFDEFHERSLESDLALALCLDIISGLRDDLRLLVMSATIDTESISQLLGRAPVINGHGTMHPVEVFHQAPGVRTDSNRPDHLAINSAEAVKRALADQEGDILAFLPGTGEIRQTAKLLEPLGAQGNLVVRPLFGDLSLADQERAVQPDPQKKQRVILATSIAETSITIEGISTVIDCGWKRVMRFNPNCGLSRLETIRISRASANQRTGRAGRLAPGVCYRLWSKGVEHGLQAFDRAEILEADLAPLALELAQWGISDPGNLAWLDKPPAGAFAQARSLLSQLDALDHKGHITTTGQKMAQLPLHPRLSHMVLRAQQHGCLPLACDLAALLSERDILKGHERSADIEERLHGLDIFRKEGPVAAQALGADAAVCRRVVKISRQLAGNKKASALKVKAGLSVGASLALAFPDRIGQLRPGTVGQYKLVSGRGAGLRRHEPIGTSPFLAVASLDAGKKDGRIFLAARIDRREILELFADQLVEGEEISWDGQTNAVRALKTIRLGLLVLSETVFANPDPEAMQEAFLLGIRTMGLDALPWNKEARELQARVGNLREWDPEGNWPDLADDTLLNSLGEWLGPFLAGIKTKAGLNGLKMLAILGSRLNWDQQKRLEKEAPTHILVPSGSRIKLSYAAGKPPVLAVRLQEMFGLAQTPAVARGRVPIVLHLLSPARRPIQITQDLAGFWNGSYHEVKKELKGRYPKHHWPDDPWQAQPTARVKPRK